MEIEVFVALSSLEVKWSNRYLQKPGELKSLIKFSSENKPSNVLVTTIDKEGTQNLDGINLHFSLQPHMLTPLVKTR